MMVAWVPLFNILTWQKVIKSMLVSPVLKTTPTHMIKGWEPVIEELSTSNLI